MLVLKLKGEAHYNFYGSGKGQLENLFFPALFPHRYDAYLVNEASVLVNGEWRLVICTEQDLYTRFMFEQNAIVEAFLLEMFVGRGFLAEDLEDELQIF